jgi:signal transduction histidine kinase
MGLGLYLVKSLVDDFHGTVRVEDRVPGDHSKGARFVVLLPAVGK